MNTENFLLALRRRRLVPPLVAASILALALWTPAAVSQSREPSGDAPVLSSIRAHLFESKTGQLSEDILNSGSSDLRNTIAGVHAANATLVVIEVSGSAGGIYTGARGPNSKYYVHLVAQEQGRKDALIDRALVLPVLGSDGKGYLSFLIHQSGCAPVSLIASLEGQRPSKPVKRLLSFSCGE